MPNVRFNRPPGRRTYVSIQKHHYTAENDHSKWIDRHFEFRTFDCADYGNLDAVAGALPSWIDAAGNLWGVQNNKPSVGLYGEHFGFFPATVNPGDDWHGFPLFPFARGQKDIPNEIFQIWEALNIISPDDIPALIKKKRI